MMVLRKKKGGEERKTRARGGLVTESIRQPEVTKCSVKLLMNLFVDI
jgi:hypothetical protein